MRPANLEDRQGRSIKVLPRCPTRLTSTRKDQFQADLLAFLRVLTLAHRRAAGRLNARPDEKAELMASASRPEDQSEQHMRGAVPGAARRPRPGG